MLLYSCMLHDLLKFSRQRSLVEAAIFYAAYLVVSLLIALVLGLLIGLLSSDVASAGALGQRLGLLVSLLMSVGLALAIVSAKHITSTKTTILILVAAGLSTVSVVFGLLPVAYLATVRGARAVSANAVQGSGGMASPASSI